MAPWFGGLTRIAGNQDNRAKTRGCIYEIFSIVDREPARIAKKTRTFGESFYLPPYPPDRNPGELAWKHLEADTPGRMVIANKAGFQRKVRSSMRQLQNDPGRIISLYQKPSLEYAA